LKAPGTARRQIRTEQLLGGRDLDLNQEIASDILKIPTKTLPLRPYILLDAFDDT
jgi:hypothetical protein